MTVTEMYSDWRYWVILIVLIVVTSVIRAVISGYWELRQERNRRRRYIRRGEVDR